MIESEHLRLEAWAKSYGVLGLLGFLSTLLVAGKLLHHLLLYRGYVMKYFIIPPALISGLIGLMWLAMMKVVDPAMAKDLVDGLDSLKLNLINFALAALTLGLFCSRSSTQHSSLRRIFHSIVHEGGPMIVYSQILIWGQSSVCLLLCTVMNSIPQMNKSFPNLFSGMVPLGIEAGPDVIPTAVYKNLWSQTVVQEAETLGLFACCIMSILVISAKQYYSYDAFENVTGKSSDGENDKSKPRKEAYTKRAFGSGEFEAFRRGSRKLSPNKIIATSALSQDLGLPPRYRNSSAPSSSSQQQTHSPMSAQWGMQVDTSQFRRDMFLDNDAALDDHLDISGVKNKNYSSLGTHVALIFICVFLSFNFGLSARFFEAEIEWFRAHRILSGIRLFEMSIVFSIVIIHYLLLCTKLSFRTEWFMRLSGLMLDMTCIAKLSSAIPDPKNVAEVHYGLISVFVLACTLWNIYVFVYFAKDMFPNFYFERAVVLSADAMGHPAMGLLFARTLDPEMSTPVPVAYICKLAMFVVPSSGGKNTIVISLVDRHGPVVALVICVCVVGAWAMIFDQYLKSRYITGNPRTGGAAEGSFKKQVSKNFSVDEKSQSLSNIRGISSSGLRNREEGGSRDVNFNFSDDNSFGDGLEFEEEGNGLEFEEGGEGDEEAEKVELLSGGGEDKSASAHTKQSGYKDFQTDHQFSAPVELKMSHESSIISYAQFQDLAGWLPSSDQTKKFVLKYSLQRDGASLASLLSLCHTGANDCFSSLIVIEDSWGYIFGGYIASALSNSRSYYGTGESFVFTLAPSANVYRSEGTNSLFVLSSVDQLLMGGGGDGFAFQLDDELNTGVSNQSETYRNPQLASNEFFKCLNVEVWTTESPGYNV
jgi:Na+/glutamate symporter